MLRMLGIFKIYILCIQGVVNILNINIVQNVVQFMIVLNVESVKFS